MIDRKIITGKLWAKNCSKMEKGRKAYDNEYFKPED